jgi:uncharacterized protein DUF6894
MPRYFFHVRDGKDFPDEEGVELDGPEKAREQAVIAAGSMLKDHGGRFWNNGEWRMVVVGEDGTTVCALRFAAEHSSEPSMAST